MVCSLEKAIFGRGGGGAVIWGLPYFLLRVSPGLFKLYLHQLSCLHYLLLSLTCCCVPGVIERLGMGVVPYVVLLVVPVLGRMSDQCEDVRLMATHCFATLIRLMPLEV